MTDLATTVHSERFLLELGPLLKTGLPALVPYETGHPVVMLSDAENEALCCNLVESLLLELLSKTPDDKHEVVLLHDGPSTRFPHVRRLLQQDRSLGRAQMAAGQLDEALRPYVKLAHERASRFATSGATSLDAFNRGQGTPERRVWLVIYAMDAYLSKAEGWGVLSGILHEGPKLGVTPLMVVRERPPTVSSRSSIIPARELEAHETQLRHWRQGFGLRFQGQVREPSDVLQRFWKLIARLGPEIRVDGERVARMADNFLAARQRLLESSGISDFLEVPIGMAGTTLVSFRLGSRSMCHHALLGGIVGSGKTNLLNSLILRICENYAPDEVQLWLVDLKDAIEFHRFGGLPHVAALSGGPAVGTPVGDVCNSFAALIAERSQRFMAVTPAVTNIDEYNALSHEPMPRAVLIVDEAQSLFEDKVLRAVAQQMLRTVAKKGRAYGMHIVLSTQSYQNLELETDIKSQFALRIAMRLSSGPDSIALFGRDNDAAARLPPYHGLLNPSQGEITDNVVFSADYLPPNTLRTRLEHLRAKYGTSLVKLARQGMGESRPHDASSNASVAPSVASVPAFADAWDSEHEAIVRRTEEIRAKHRR